MGIYKTSRFSKDPKMNEHLTGRLFEIYSSFFFANTGEGDYNTDISGLFNTYILTAITPEKWEIGKNDEMTAIKPLSPKIAQCYGGPPL